MTDRPSDDSGEDETTVKVVYSDPEKTVVLTPDADQVPPLAASDDATVKLDPALPKADDEKTVVTARPAPPSSWSPAASPFDPPELAPNAPPPVPPVPAPAPAPAVGSSAEAPAGPSSYLPPVPAPAPAPAVGSSAEAPAGPSSYLPPVPAPAPAPAAGSSAEAPAGPSSYLPPVTGSGGYAPTTTYGTPAPSTPAAAATPILAPGTSSRGGRRARWLIPTAGAVGVALLAGVGVLIIQPRPVKALFAHRLNVTSAQSQIRAVLSDTTTGYALPQVSNISCNHGIDPKIIGGDTFDCDVIVAGHPLRATMTFINDDGAFFVGRPQ